MSERDEYLTLYADYVCPFCYLEQQSIARYRRNQGNGFEVDWYPYDIRHQIRTPDGELDENENKGYPDRVHQEIERLKRQHDEGDMLDLDEVPHVDSLSAQVASLDIKHEQPDRWSEFSEAVFGALWRDGRDISDVETLTEIAGSVDIDGDEVRDAVADDGLRNQVLEAFADARQDGVTDVPTLVYNDQTIREVISVEELRQLVRNA